ncbi:MAG TPA: hypothetical protein VG937_20840 [Polyangiaceae bacterium]|nr:hypothetical protein [Polyangiaceae bacterium]
MADFLATAPILLVFAWIALRRIRQFDAAERPLLWLAFLMHQLAGFVNIGVTKLYYGYGDMLSYYRFGLVASDRLHSDFWGLTPGLLGLIFRQPDPVAIPVDTLSPMSSTGSMQGLASFMTYFLFDSLYAICAVIAGLSFLSKVALYVVAREELPEIPPRSLLMTCLLLPSALFWSCSLLKEPIAMIGLLVAIHSWHSVAKRRNIVRSAILGILGSTVIILFKGYIFPALGLAIGAWYLIKNVRNKRGDIALTLGHAAIAAGAAIGIIAITGLLLPRFSADALSDQLADIQNVGARVNGRANYSLGEKAGIANSQVALAPLGLFTALFRPTLLEATTPLVLIGALEMTAFLIATLVVPFRRGIPAALSELLKKPFLGFCAMFVLIFGTCVGLATTNLGTLSRYRMPLTPFFATILVALLTRRRVSTAFRASGAPGPSPTPLGTASQLPARST